MDIFVSFKENRKLILIPLVIVLLILTVLLLVVAVTGPLAPFVYPLL